jgi:hypothetical protein
MKLMQMHAPNKTCAWPFLWLFLSLFFYFYFAGCHQYVRWIHLDACASNMVRRIRTQRSFNLAPLDNSYSLTSSSYTIRAFLSNKCIIIIIIFYMFTQGGKRGIRTSDLCFMRRGPTSRLNYLFWTNKYICIAVFVFTFCILWFR